jgi:FKBP-type peptidyl-prolyl cis-trans isomerase
MRRDFIVLAALILTGCANVTRDTWVTADGSVNRINELQQRHQYCMGRANSDDLAGTAIGGGGIVGRSVRRTLYKDCMEEYGYRKVRTEQVALGEGNTCGQANQTCTLKSSDLNPFGYDLAAASPPAAVSTPTVVTPPAVVSGPAVLPPSAVAPPPAAVSPPPATVPVPQPTAQGDTITTISGVMIKTLRPGTGPAPTAPDRVRMHYDGYLLDGTVFDSSIQRGDPVVWPLNGVIRCLTDGVPMMKVGGKSRLMCPPHTAYGDRGKPPLIAPGASLIFEIELLGIVK